ncbi:hypothetical protein KM900_19705 [Bacillus subtilis]|uniref:hypothetical protein n=1 Tax=Bacillus subtilis group TaxID=653685 RepID=UPI001C23CBAD|nr:hypothetical protein [Bacillus subtilis]MBU8572712.1 hypothetical protein [Bacillus subtilis]MBU8625602.1 hypothetical protein [Bacillus subtilis]
MAYTAVSKELAAKTRKLTKLLPEVLEVTGFSKLQLHAKIGGKNAEFIDIKNEVIMDPDHFVALWSKGLIKYLDDIGEHKENSKVYEMLKLIQKYEVVRDYTFTFLERTYLRHYTDLSKKRPTVEEATMWIGQRNASYGLLVTPRFANGNWENDQSEIRRFKKNYWTIGHVLQTGLVIPFVDEKIEFHDIDQYLSFFKNTMVRASGSQYELEIAQRYCDFVRNSENPEDVPLLIPEFRYDGIADNHKYRLDFTIIDPKTLNKYGFELSPWSTHGYLKGTKGKLQKEINEEAKQNFEKEMTKHKSYFKKFGIFVLIYTDIDLANIDKVFKDMESYLNPESTQTQLKLHILDDLLKYD